MNIAELHTLIAAVCPIDGINSEGVIWFKAEATEGQQAAAQAVMDANLSQLGAPPGPPTPYEEEEIKRKLLAEAVPKRDTLLFHLERFRVRAVEELAAAVGQPAIDAATAKKQAIDAAIAGLEGMFNDQRVVDAIDGAVAGAVKQVYLEIFYALAQAAPATYLALKALDPL